MSKFISDPIFGHLATRLGQIDVEATYRDAMRSAAEEGVEMLRIELDAEGAPEGIRQAIRPLTVTGLTGAAGIRDSDPASDDALEWEYGAMDHSTPPHGTFQMVSEDMADFASWEAGQLFSAQIADAS